MLRIIGIAVLTLGFFAGCGHPVKEPAKTQTVNKIEVKKSPVVKRGAVPSRKVITVAANVVTPQKTGEAVLTPAEKSRRNEINISKLNTQIEIFKFKNNALPKDLGEVKQAVKTVPVEVYSGRNDIHLDKNGQGGWYYNMTKGVFDLNQ